MIIENKAIKYSGYTNIFSLILKNLRKIVTPRANIYLISGEHQSIRVHIYFFK